MESHIFLETDLKPSIPNNYQGRLAGLKSTTTQLRKKTERVFKFLWYTIRKDDLRGLPHATPAHDCDAEFADALNSMLSLFQNEPFAMATHAEVNARLPILNRDSTFDGFTEFMQRAGTAWINDRLLQPPEHALSDNSPIDMLREAQISLFEILWSRTLEQRREKQEQERLPQLAPSQEITTFSQPLADAELPTYSLESGPAPSSSRSNEGSSLPLLESTSPHFLESRPEPKYESCEDIEILARVLQASIFRAKSPSFVTAFCGKAKSGKSLFLNALIGAPLLPSDGMSSRYNVKFS